MKRIILASCFLLSWVCLASADMLLSTHQLFTGRNVYAPTLINDGTYKMWYGGWETQQDADAGKDKIYYRTSSDNMTWSPPKTVLLPSDIGPNAVHVNDPSVTKHWNARDSKWEYTMFYTVCISPCSQADNQIWSSMSADGETWSFHQMLLSGASGPAEPAAIVDPETDGTFWKVYYVDRATDPQKIKMARVDGARSAFSIVTVFTYTKALGISGAEVRQFNGKWHLFFNTFFALSATQLDRVDIYKSESTSNVAWPTDTAEILIENTGATYCATITPGVLPTGGRGGNLYFGLEDRYDLYFGLTPRQADGSCDISKQGSIERWYWQD